MRREHFDYQYGDEIEADRAAEARTRPTLGHPLCEADAEARRESLAQDAAERAARSRKLGIEIRAEQRAACNIRWDREFAYLLQNIGRIRALRRHHGFDDPLIDEGRELIHRAFKQMCEPNHKGGNE